MATDWRKVLDDGGCLELSLAVDKLPRMDLASKSDPFCVVYSRSASREWERIGMTETLMDCHKCMWTTKFLFLSDDRLTELRFEVYDRDSVRDDLKDHDFIGFAEGTVLLDLLQSDKSVMELPLRRGAGSGKIKQGSICFMLDFLQQPPVNLDITFQVRVGYSVRAKLYFQITKRLLTGGSYVPIYRSTLLDKGKSNFAPKTLTLRKLSGGDGERPIRLEILRFYPMGRSKVLGYIKTTPNAMLQLAGRQQFDWHAPKKGLATGKVFVESASDVAPPNRAFQVSLVE